MYLPQGYSTMFSLPAEGVSAGIRGQVRLSLAGQSRRFRL